MKALTFVSLSLIFMTFAGCMKNDAGSEFRVAAQFARGLTGKENKADIQAKFGEPASIVERDDKSVWSYVNPKNRADDLTISFNGEKIVVVILTESGEGYIRDFRRP